MADLLDMATEDHDLAEVDQAALLTKTDVEILKAGLRVPLPVPVGGVELNSETAPLLDQAIERATELLEFARDRGVDSRVVSSPKELTPASAFGRLIARIFAEQGLIVVDAGEPRVSCTGCLDAAIRHRACRGAASGAACSIGGVDQAWLSCAGPGR